MVAVGYARMGVVKGRAVRYIVVSKRRGDIERLSRGRVAEVVGGEEDDGDDGGEHDEDLAELERSAAHVLCAGEPGGGSGVAEDGRGVAVGGEEGGGHVGAGKGQGGLSARASYYY